MSITFFNQWLQWIDTGSWNWSEFDVINVSFERDKTVGDWGIDVALLGLGFHFHHITKATAEYWADVAEKEGRR